MIDELDDVDLRYLQNGDFLAGKPGPWVWPGNVFERRLAGNVRPGMTMLIDMETLVRGLGGAALMFPRRAVTVELDLQSEPVWVKFVSLTDEMLPICCDDAGSLLPALRWYQCRGERLLRVAVMAPQFFWFPLMGSIGTR